MMAEWKAYMATSQTQGVAVDATKMKAMYSNSEGAGFSQAYTKQIKSKTFEDEHDEWRYFFHELKEKEQKERLEEQIDLPSFNVTELDIKLSKEAPRATIDYQLEIRKLVKKTSRRIFLTPNLLSRKSYIPSTKEQKFPIESVKGYTHIDTITYTIPKGYVIENIPHDTFELSTDFGKYSMNVALQGNELTYIREFQLFAFSKSKYSFTKYL